MVVVAEIEVGDDRVKPGTWKWKWGWREGVLKELELKGTGS